ncbi:uncharacterized protein MEPE_05766 [Melanopsichium pennsylvanicum]|uniref:BHLH domain-containing protein n=2 Tax=Melanopsichium pennsylvanicum TaxID=63383 RepID=A0AAJ4XSE9_9BASI|nr:putative protein [Melanopsichium pennsylvanicum 4]SNX87056.1 uncharacterized protein MEPE_05766 [Melanopsichium pennsylvanicum]
MTSIKSEPDTTNRGRSPGPAGDRRKSGLSELGIDSPAPPAARTSKRRKRSELSPSSKQTHSIIEKERREAMNEKFSELAASIPELVEALASGKRPTKGEIVKASIARHQEQERRVRELEFEVQMLRSGSAPGANQPSGFEAIETPSPMSRDPMTQNGAAPQLALPYQIQASHPIGAGMTSAPTAAGDLWVDHMLSKPHEPLALDAPQPLSMLPDMVQPVSPFKQTSMMNNWASLSSLPIAPLDPATLSISFSSSGLIKGFMESGTLNHLSRRPSGANTSGFSSPTFTSSDSDSSFSTDALETSLDDGRRGLFGGVESMSFEPFAALQGNTVEQTPLTSLVGLPATGELGHTVAKKARKVGNTGRARGRKNEGKEKAI